MKIISVGGSIVIPKTGFDLDFLKKFRALILKEVKKGEKFVIVIGGGATCRTYQDTARKFGKVTKDDLDWIGIKTTLLNAELVRVLFDGYSHKTVIINNRERVKTKFPIIIAGGEKPGHSTDMDAMLFAQTYKASEVLNLSNIDFVYTKDPNKFKDAVKIENIAWKDFRKNVVGYTWDPGKNAPFDPIASGLAEKNKVIVSILNGNNLAEVTKALQGKKFIGTKVHP